MILSSGLNEWTEHVPMIIYEEIHRWFVYKSKEQRHIRVKNIRQNNNNSVICLMLIKCINTCISNDSINNTAIVLFVIINISTLICFILYNIHSNLCGLDIFSYYSSIQSLVFLCLSFHLCRV